MVIITLIFLFHVPPFQQKQRKQFIKFSSKVCKTGDKNGIKPFFAPQPSLDNHGQLMLLCWLLFIRFSWFFVATCYWNFLFLFPQKCFCLLFFYGCDSVEIRFKNIKIKTSISKAAKNCHSSSSNLSFSALFL